MADNNNTYKRSSTPGWRRS